MTDHGLTAARSVVEPATHPTTPARPVSGVSVDHSAVSDAIPPQRQPPPLNRAMWVHLGELEPRIPDGLPLKTPSRTNPGDTVTNTDQTVRVRIPNINAVDEYPNARFAINDHRDLEIFRTGDADDHIGYYPTGRYTSVRLADPDQPEQVDGPLSQVVAETIVRAIQEHCALVPDTTRDGGAESTAFRKGLLAGAIIARRVGQTTGSNQPSTDREGSPQ